MEREEGRAGEERKREKKEKGRKTKVVARTQQTALVRAGKADLPSGIALTGKLLATESLRATAGGNSFVFLVRAPSKEWPHAHKLPRLRHGAGEVGGSSSSLPLGKTTLGSSQSP